MVTYAGSLLRVNLTKKSIDRENVNEDVRRAFIGGRGLGVKYLFDELRPGIDPLGPDNKLLLLTGPLAGTHALSFSRWIAMTKSPLTGGIMRAVGGGDFGAWMKFAGFDFIILEGSSETPVYLNIDAEEARLLPAEDLWGLDTEQTQKRLKEIHGTSTRVACIGPAGENLVPYACIITDWSAAARGGVGTVMGSKGLKAVAISNVTRRESFSAVRELSKKEAAALKDMSTPLALKKYGTPAMFLRFYDMGILPLYNFQGGSLKGIENLGAEAYLALKKGDEGCYACSVHCSQIREVQYGAFAGYKNSGPEYETIWAFGPNIGSINAGAVIAADRMCDLLGLDTITTGSTIGFAYELFQRGILTKKDTDGRELVWGQYKPALELIESIVKREGLGKILAEGTRQAAKVIGQGADAYAMHVKGLEFPAYEPRSAKGQALDFAVSNIGASHMYGRVHQELAGDTLPRPVDRLADEGKGDIVLYNQKLNAIRETGVMCSMIRTLPSSLTQEFLAISSGVDELRDEKQYELVGERIVCLDRAFNVREGFSRKDDTLPSRMFNEPLKSASAANGQVVRKFDTLLDEYYGAAGYSHDGVPLPETLSKLGLGWVQEELSKITH
ncbi:MAG: aldehyde ferredoxin oxidoreductase family protein [Dehalococcoidia bacterium]|jgi:aldehyde:ferredoxin oxidoreductase